MVSPSRQDVKLLHVKVCFGQLGVAGKRSEATLRAGFMVFPLKHQVWKIHLPHAQHRDFQMK